MASNGKLSTALRRVKEGNWPRPNSRMKAIRTLSPREKAKYARLYESKLHQIAFHFDPAIYDCLVVIETEYLMDTVLDASLCRKYDGLTAEDWNILELESKRRRGLPLVLGGKRVFQSRYTSVFIP